MSVRALPAATAPAAETRFENRVLILAPTGNDSRLTADFLRHAGIAALPCRDVPELCGRVEEGCGAVVLAEETLGTSAVAQLVKTLSRQPAWSDIPIAIITSGGEASQARLRRLTVFGPGGNVALLERPFRPETLVSTVEVALRARRRQHQVRELLRRQQESEERLMGILDSISDAFVALDRDWRIIYVNPSYLKLVAPLYGSADELLGWNLWEKFPELVGTELGRFYERTMKEQVVGRLEFFYEPLDAWLEVRASPSPLMLSVYAQDVTERKRHESALEEAKNIAEAANHSKDRFLAVLSHELRTPLTPVLMTASVLESDPALTPELRASMAMIRRNVELETKLIDDLLDLSRITAGKLPLRLQAVELNDAVRHVCEICRQQVAEKGVRLRMDLEAEEGWVRADPARLQQILWNVLKNAVKFTADGGSIEVTTRRLENGCMQVKVRDSGIGIDPEVLPKIFDAFEQGDPRITRQFGGLGLGLAITKALVELHSGKIRAESDGLGRGSAFSVELPAAVAERPAGLGPGRDPGGDEPLRILVAEDHPDTAKLLARLLESCGYDVTVAGSAARAVEVADRNTFDVVISDIGLPDATGYELMRRLRGRHEIRGIAMSGYGMEEDIRKSLDAGFAEHLVKPVDFSSLERAIRRLAQPV